MIAGRVTAEGTKRYVDRMASSVAASHYKVIQDWSLSSIGLGTYLGEADPATDDSYKNAILTAIDSGCNLVDTAINYRLQQSERSVGAALIQGIGEGRFSREEVLISTKGGFLPFDGEYPANPSRYIYEEYVAKKIIAPDEIVAGCHCMSPSYLEDQLEKSLKNLNLETVDVYFLHNPETQLTEITRQEFLKRTRAAFRLLESKVADGKIQIYGMATWNGFREPKESKSYLSLEELIGLAREVGGDDHHFRALQLPYNLAMPEALLTNNQMFGSEATSLLDAARKQNFLVLCSASILQGRLASNLPRYVMDFFDDLATDAQKSIQFVRSTPGVTAGLVGMSNLKHVSENMEVAKHPPVAWPKMKALFST